jgi:hypothetical protein
MRKPIYKSLALFLMLCRLWRGAAFVSLHGKNSNNKNYNSNSNNNSNKLRNTQPASSIGLQAKVASEEVRERLVKQLAILREKDRKTKVIKGEVSKQASIPAYIHTYISYIRVFIRVFFHPT